MRRISNNYHAYGTLSPLELNEMTGGFMMGLIMKFSAPVLQPEIRKSWREGESINDARYDDANDKFVPR